MLKKLLIFNLIAVFLFNSVSCAYASSFSEQTKKEAVTSDNKALYLRRYPPSYYHVDCSSVVSDAVCSSLVVTKEELQLKSELKKDYVAYFYTIKNNYEKPVIFKNVSNERDAKRIAKEITSERDKKRFPKSLIYFANAPAAVLAGGMAIGLMPLIYPLGCMFEGSNEANKFLGQAIVYPVYMPIVCVSQGTWYTMITPLNLVSDKKADKKFKEDVSNVLAKEFKEVEVEPQKDFKFVVLLKRTNFESKMALNFRPRNSFYSYSMYK